MPLRNRVTPMSELVADRARGLVYGNRGCLHDCHGRADYRLLRERWGGADAIDARAGTRWCRCTTRRRRALVVLAPR